MQKSRKFLTCAKRGTAQKHGAKHIKRPRRALTTLRQLLAWRKQGLSTRTDLTDEVLDYVARTSFAGNRDQAVRFASQNPDQFRAQAQPYLAERKNRLIQRIASSGQILSSEEMGRTFASWKKEITPEREDLSGTFDSQPVPAHSVKNTPEDKEIKDIPESLQKSKHDIETESLRKQMVMKEILYGPQEAQKKTQIDKV